MLKKTIYFFLFFLGIFVLCSQVKADENTPAQAQGLTISPPINEFSVSPGNKSSQTIRVTNPTQNLVEVYPLAMNFNSQGEGGEPAFAEPNSEESKFSLANWITFSQPKIALTPNQVVDFQYIVNVPENAEPGGHYGVVFFSTNPPEKNTGGPQVTITSMVGSLILVKVPGAVRESALLEEFSAARFFLKPPVKFTTKILNRGNIHFKPVGEISIKDWKGAEVEKINFNSNLGNVLPDSTRRFDYNWLANDLPFWKIPIGRFSAQLSLRYGEGQFPLDSTIYFWIIPKWIILTCAGAFIVLLSIILMIIWKQR